MPALPGVADHTLARAEHSRPGAGRDRNRQFPVRRPLLIRHNSDPQQRPAISHVVQARPRRGQAGSAEFGSTHTLVGI